MYTRTLRVLRTAKQKFTISEDGVAVGVFVLVSLFGMGTGMMGGSHLWGDGHMWGAGSGAPGWVFLAGVVLSYRALTDGEDSDEALEELRLAYARGDLSDDEFEQHRERLEREP